MQHLVGHSSASLTVDACAHAIPVNDEVTAVIMGGRASGAGTEPQVAPPAGPRLGRGTGVTRKLIGALSAQLPPESLVELLKSVA